MICHVRGLLSEKDPMRVVVEAAGVGYELFIPISTYDHLPRVGEEVKLLTHHCVREDDETLFGFSTADERELFLKLVSVSGVGPKIAIAILSGSSIGELAMAITAGDAKRLSSIKGVGKKTAEKICVELRDKVSALAMGAGTARSGGSTTPIIADAVAALRALGFNEETSSKMVADVMSQHADADSVEKIIKLALKGK